MPVLVAEADVPPQVFTNHPKTLEPHGKFAKHLAGMYGNIVHTTDLPDTLVGKTMVRACRDLTAAGCSTHTFQALVQGSNYQEAADHYTTFLTLMKGQKILQALRENQHNME